MERVYKVTLPDTREAFIDIDRYKTHLFVITKSFPSFGQVWNIGRKGFPHKEYIPICSRTCGWEHKVLNGCLFALKVESEELALEILRVAQYQTVGAKVFNSLLYEYHIKKSNEKYLSYTSVK